VTFADEGDTDEALSLNGHAMNKIRLVVNFAKKKAAGGGRIESRRSTIQCADRLSGIR
jgi:hypothetical protein